MCVCVCVCVCVCGRGDYSPSFLGEGDFPAEISLLSLFIHTCMHTQTHTHAQTHTHTHTSTHKHTHTHTHTSINRGVVGDIVKSDIIVHPTIFLDSALGTCCYFVHLKSDTFFYALSTKTTLPGCKLFMSRVLEWRLDIKGL